MRDMQVTEKLTMLPTSMAPTATIATVDPVVVRFRVITLRLFSPNCLRQQMIKKNTKA